MAGGGNPGLPGSVPGVPFAKGDDPRRGRGLKGRAGRKSAAYKDYLRTLLASKASRAAVKRILSDPDHPHHAQLYKIALAHVEGVPRQVVEVDVDLPTFTVERA